MNPKRPDLSARLAALIETVNKVAAGEESPESADGAFTEAMEAALRQLPVDPYEAEESTTPPAIVAANVRRLRDEAGLSQAALADAMNTAGFDSWNRQTVAEVEGYERRLSRRVSWEEAWALAALFSVPLVEIIAPHEPITVALGEYMAVAAADVEEFVVGQKGRRGVGGLHWTPALHASDTPVKDRPAAPLWAARRGDK